MTIANFDMDETKKAKRFFIFYWVRLSKGQSSKRSMASARKLKGYDMTMPMILPYRNTKSQNWKNEDEFYAWAEQPLRPLFRQSASCLAIACLLFGVLSFCKPVIDPAVLGHQSASGLPGFYVSRADYASSSTADRVQVADKSVAQD